MKPEVLKLMKCPYCDSGLCLGEIYQEKEGLIEGYMACECNNYPLLDGILLLTGSPMNNYLIQLIKKRKTNQAIGLALEKFNEVAYNTTGTIRSKGIYGKVFGTFLWQLVKLNARICYRKHSKGLNLPFYDFLGDGNFDNYLKDRFSAESLWSFYPFIQMLKESNERILDLSCGAGHTSFILSANVKPGQLFCADYSFRNLRLASKYFVRDATFICLDANYPLPFRDDVFSSLLMLDAFHSIQSRASLAREMERVLSPQGLLLLLHEHSSLYRDFAYGHPLSPSGWAHLFQQLPVKVLPERPVVEDLILMDKLDLAKKYSEADLNSSNALIVVGSENQSILKTYRDIWADIVNNKSKLIINPIYKIERIREDDSDRILLERSFPSDYFRREYPITEKYLPEKCIISSNLSQAVKGRTLEINYSEASESDLRCIEQLMKSFVVINVPDNYYRRSHSK